MPIRIPFKVRSPFLSLIANGCTRAFSGRRYAGEEAGIALDWVRKFESRKLGREDVHLEFTRSSGPGGQNVNKVNTKVVIRCPLDSTPWIPVWCRENLRTLPAYVPSSRSIMVTSTRFRSQAQNVEDGLRKLHDTILSCIRGFIVNEPTEEQRQHVRNLEKKGKAKMRIEKERRGNVKSLRSRVRFDD
ncbi:RF-1 domain-containing protein [Cantharellus anzutake]|uniref:RF-1 domain-containing protein n=1 Tax=Cantharellus anzutake TaxID=1750568 RepID=UPI0019030B19|nr:RF-1 domain-containing protein [Cantharellus anzutake]KAF8339662.1 RF-1 domain-containing protein [Cantharellus anzutake]